MNVPYRDYFIWILIMAKFNPHDFIRTEQWQQRFQRYLMATKLNPETADVQVSTLVYVLGKGAEHICNTFMFEEDEDDDNYETVLVELNNYIVLKVNGIHEGTRFDPGVQ